MVFHNIQKNIRTNAEIERKAEELRKKFQENFNSISQVYRAGIICLYRKKIEGRL